MDACIKSGFEPQIVHESSHWDTISGLVSAGLGVALVTSSVANSLPDRCDIEQIALREKFNATIALIIRKDLNAVRCMNTFTNFTLDWIKKSGY